MATPCLTAGCRCPSKSRGLCKSCYKSSLYQVSLGRTSWEQLAREGKALHKIQVVRPEEAFAKANASAVGSTAPNAREVRCAE